jgi:hypothetical protein
MRGFLKYMRSFVEPFVDRAEKFEIHIASSFPVKIDDFRHRFS